MVFLADPQLIDPHSYPGRPWPLSTFTVLHTDNYLSRSYIQLQKALHPDTIFFLGDLFDGGREWSTRQGDSDDPAWAKDLRPSDEKAQLKTWKKNYGEDFWLREYNRFGKIFFTHWNDGGKEPGVGQRGRKIIAGLPGNHDLGFGAQIKIPVRDRFQAYFGDTNRVDVIANHTFVSVDSVSLSASSSDQPGANTEEIYGPVDEFLKGVQPLKRKAVERELRYLNGKSEDLLNKHSIDHLSEADFSHNPTLDPGQGAPGLPTILLTHVPLYREPGTPCGPMREHWPPAKPSKGQTAPVNPDHRNAISVSKGYQYQNVLSETDSIRLISSIGDVVSVFSGDDHDYCEIVHPANKNNAREITVKSMSWAMGVRRPGFLMLSLWNPIDSTGAPIGTHGGGHGASTPHSGGTTMESHLCLLPDQLGIFIRYLTLLVLSLAALLIRAILTPILNLEPFSPSHTASTHSNNLALLPTFRQDTKRARDVEEYHSRSSNSSTSSTASNGALAPRSTTARTRSVSPSAGGYGLPPSQARSTPPPIISNGGYGAEREVWDDGDDYGRKGKAVGAGEVKKLRNVEVMLREAWTSVWRVVWVVMVVYLWLGRYG